MRRVLSLEIGIEKPYFKPGAALRETKNVPRVLILQEARLVNLKAFGPHGPMIVIISYLGTLLERSATRPCGKL
jgi:hypothetical protein